VGPKILLADDETTLLRLFSTVLERAGYVTLEAASSTEAASLFSQHADEIEALVLDVNLPPDGAETVLEGVLARRPEMPFLIVSGQPLEGALASEVAQSTTGHFMPKPFRPSELLAWVEALP
jgi:DNA-binding response OmpR family regulator